MTQNIDAFNELAGWILSKLYESHPLKVRLRLADVPAPIAEKVQSVCADQRTYRRFWHQSATWLENEGFISIGSKTLSETDFGPTSLTMIGLRALNAVPNSLERKEPLGEQLVDELKDAGREVRGAAIAQLVGHIFGAFTRSVGN